MRHTGGVASGATSTKSRSDCLASSRASGRVLIPNWLPCASMRRTSRARMRSLYRGSFVAVAMAVHSCAMALPFDCPINLDNRYKGHARSRSTQHVQRDPDALPLTGWLGGANPLLPMYCWKDYRQNAAFNLFCHVPSPP